MKPTRNPFHLTLKTLSLILSSWILIACDKSVSSPAVINFQLAKSDLNTLWVATSDYRTGELEKIDLLQARAPRIKVPVHSDAVVRVPVEGGYYYVVNRFGADNIQRGKKENGQVLGQFNVGQQSNPQDIAVLSEEVAYVSRLKSHQILKVNPKTGAKLKEIDPFENADPKDRASSDKDGFHEFTWMRLFNDKLFITLQRLNNFKPSDKSQIVVLDVASDRVERILTLKGTNPNTEIKTWDDEIYVGEAGKLGVLDGGIEVWDRNLSSRGWVTTEKELGGDLKDCALLDSERGIALVDKDVVTELVSFRRSDGKVTGILKATGKYSLQQILVDFERGIFFVSDRDSQRPGIEIYDLLTLKPVKDGFISTHLPPFHMVLAD